MFPDNLKYFRKRANLTQQELADKLGVSRSTIGMYEYGGREPDFETLEMIADFFNVNMSTLIGEKEKAPTEIGEGSKVFEKFSQLDEAEKAYILGQIDALLSKRK